MNSHVGCVVLRGGFKSFCSSTFILSFMLPVPPSHQFPVVASARAVLLVLGARLLLAGGPTYLWAPSENRLLSWPGWGHSGSVVIVTFVSIHCTKLHFLLLTGYCKYPSVSLELFINFALPNILKHKYRSDTCSM